MTKLRFFTNENEGCFFVKKFNSNDFIPIPRVGEDVWIDDRYDKNDFDFFTVQKIIHTISKSDDVFVDVIVEGKCTDYVEEKENDNN